MAAHGSLPTFEVATHLAELAVAESKDHLDPFANLWVMRREKGGTRREKASMLRVDYEGGDRASWFERLTQLAVDLEAVAAVLVEEETEGGERCAVVQLEQRGAAPKLWRGRIVSTGGGRPSVPSLEEDPAANPPKRVLPRDRSDPS